MRNSFLRGCHKPNWPYQNGLKLAAMQSACVESFGFDEAVILFLLITFIRLHYSIFRKSDIILS